jgi:hypothetical protein
LNDKEILYSCIGGQFLIVQNPLDMLADILDAPMLSERVKELNRETNSSVIVLISKLLTAIAFVMIVILPPLNTCATVLLFTLFVFAFCTDFAIGSYRYVDIKNTIQKLE